MDLRRIAQTNNMSSPRPSSTHSRDSSAGPSSPAFPSTPRPRLSHPVTIVRSPLTTPSLSASVPFDWDAARSRRNPPYPSPASAKAPGRGRKSELGGLQGTPAKKRVVRKKSFFEKITSIPSRIAFEMSIFPHNLPLPESKTSAYIIGGLMHLINFYVRVTQVSGVPESDTGWEDMYREDNNVSWFDWTVPMTALLILAACANALYLFTRTRLYHLYTQPDPVASPHARFVNTPSTPPSLPKQVRSYLWRGFIGFWRFLFGIGTSASTGGAVGAGERVQELSVWAPGDFELMLFSVYSPVHALLWMCWNSGNWIKMVLVMTGVGIQLRIMMRTYEALLKDRGIIAAEVMHEYDHKFVYPRVNPIRSDASVQTHEGEVVNVWED
ncbi:hypothetical protein DENSPDRAFT_96624 [Dentipellis sp. KUC8613]|nr:hypothetical protein DENSPDRAFT_96624 [Dentipellis sp. KUC8613]